MYITHHHTETVLDTTWIILPHAMEYTFLQQVTTCLHVPAHQIIVIAKNNEENLKNYCDYLKLHYLWSSSTFNFAEACNAGIRFALSHGAKYIGIIKNEVELLTDVIDQLVTVLLTEENVGASVPTEITNKNQLNALVYSKKWQLKSLDIKPEVVKPIGNPLISEADYFDFNCVLFPAQIFQAIGSFNVDYDEDANLEFSYRLWLQGYRIVYHQAAQIRAPDHVDRMIFTPHKDRFAKQYLNWAVHFIKQNCTWLSWFTIEHHLHDYFERYGLLDSHGPILKLGHPSEPTPYLFTVWETTQFPEMFKQSLAHYEHIFVPSQWNVEILKNAHFQNVSYVPLGFEPDHYHPNGSKFNFDKEKVFLVVCQEQYRKAIDVSIAVWLKVRKAMPKAWFYFFGRNIKMDHYLKRKCDQWQIYDNLKAEIYQDERIIYLEPLRIFDFHEMAELYRGADVLVMNSRSEGFGFPIIEAMACNTLTIVPHYGATAEFIHENNCISLNGTVAPADYSEFNFDNVGNWWEPNPDHLAECFMRAYTISDNDHKLITGAARQFVLKNYTWRNSMLAMRNALERFQPPLVLSRETANQSPKKTIKHSYAAEKIKKCGKRMIQYGETLERDDYLHANIRMVRFLINKITRPLWQQMNAISQYIQSKETPISLSDQLVLKLSRADTERYPLRDQWYSSTQPMVSILILNFNKSELTLRCIKEIWRHTASVAYEIIVVDNGSDQADYQNLLTIDRGFCQVIRLDINRYFPEGNNIAAETAKGDYLFCLNNDAFVTENWLAPLVATLKTRNDIGIVGPMLLNVDGSLQGAGYLVQDKTIISIGENDDANKSIYHEEKEVDFICGAGCLISKKNFDRVGGFDYFWDVGYYEDVDLAFKIKLLNKKILYVPQSKIYHIKNATARTYTSLAFSSVKRNHEKFFYRWETALTQGFSECSLKEALPLLPNISNAKKQTIGFYMAYSLTLNGFQKYLLTLIAHLSCSYKIILLFSEKYSLYALKNCMGLFGLGAFDITIDKKSNADQYQFDLLVAMDDFIPTPSLRGNQNFYIGQAGSTCPLENSPIHFFASYDGLIVPTAKIADTYRQKMNKHAGPSVPIHITQVPGIKAHHIKSTVLKSTETIHILSVNAFLKDDYHNQSTLIQAFSKLYKRKSNVALHLLGRLYDIECLQSLKKLFLYSPIYFYLDSSLDKLHDLYKMAHIYWQMPDLGNVKTDKKFNFNLPIIEAMSYGCVPIIFKNNENAEYVTEGKDGLYYATEQELIKHSDDLIKQPTYLEQLAANAIKRSRYYSEENFIERAYRAFGLTSATTMF